MAGRTGVSRPLMPRGPGLRGARRISSYPVPHGLLRHPFRHRAQRILKCMLRREAQHAARLGDVGEAIADIPRPGLLQDGGRHVAVHRAGQHAGDLLDGIGPAAADVDDLVADPRLLECQAEGGGHVAHMHEIALLPAILEDPGRLAGGDAGGEIRQHAGIGVGQRLPGAEYVEQPQRHRGCPVGPAKYQHGLFLEVLGQRIDRSQVGRARLIGSAPGTAAPHQPNAGPTGRPRPAAHRAARCPRRGHPRCGSALRHRRSSRMQPRSAPPDGG